VKYTKHVTDRSRERAREDYLKAVYQLGRTAPVRSTDLARYLGISRSSVSQFRRILERDGYVHRSANRLDTLRLTERGLGLAVRMVRRHRILETFLHASLDVPLELVHAEAERIEHVVSDDIVLRLAHMLGRPECDSHGHRIPYDDVPEPVESTVRLCEVPVGTRVVVTSIDDRDPEIVKFLAAARVLPGLRAAVRQSGMRVVLESGGAPDTVELTQGAARAVHCAVVSAHA